MIEIVTRLSQKHAVDNFFRLQYGEGYQKILRPFEPISDDDLLMAIIENKNLVPRRLMLTDRDREVVKLTIPQTSETIEHTLPGKSAVIILERERCSRDFGKKIARQYLSIKPDKDHRLHTATVKEIDDAGWLVHWVPYQLINGKFLHAQLTAKRTVFNGEDPTITDAESLANAFRLVE